MRNYCLSIFLLFSIPAFSQDSIPKEYSLNDFYIPNPTLDVKINFLMESMSDEKKVAQMIMPSAGKLGKPTEHVLRLTREGKIGGIILLNGTKPEFTRLSRMFDSTSIANGGLPLVFTADAELSLINMKIKETVPVKYANKIKNVEELEAETQKVCDELKAMGIQWNFAPVVDLNPNATVGFRSFGLSKETIVNYSNHFNAISAKNNIVTTAKHFPGHGFVVGDTHKQLVWIDGEMKETEVYVPLIKNNVISIMVGHIAVKNNPKYNTNDVPSTISRTIVTDLLRKEMGFNGVIITDAMGMKAVSDVPHCGLKAAMAGCDVILMPKDEDEVYNDILAEIKINPEFRKQVDESVKRILRMKICLGLIK